MQNVRKVLLLHAITVLLTTPLFAARKHTKAVNASLPSKTNYFNYRHPCNAPNKCQQTCKLFLHTKPSGSMKVCCVCSRPNVIPRVIRQVGFGISQPITLTLVWVKSSGLVRFPLHLSSFRYHRGTPLSALSIFLWVVRWRPVHESATPSSSLRVAGEANWGGLTSLWTQAKV